MRRRRHYAAVAFAIGACLSSAHAAEPEHPLRPRLAVVITIDQCRGDFLERFAPHFTADGFRRLLEHGANFVQCHYAHAATKTAVGHATLLTGAHPSTHGIVGNEWIDATTWTPVVAVADDNAPIIGGADGQEGRSPRRLEAETLGDVLKRELGESARICAVANKDRSAILPAGRQGDSVFWLGDNDLFVSSQYYFPDGKLPDWVESLNAQQPIARYFGRSWDRLLERERYDRTQGPDDAPGEFDGFGLGRTFPRVINGGRETPSRDFSEAFDRVPFAAEVIAEFARAMVEHEQLGADEITDLLCIGFSQPDAVGHAYGPDSHEVMDSFLRLDRILADFLRFLDEQVGRDRYLVVLTADHGIPSMPETLQQRQPATPAARVDLRPIDRAVTVALIATFGFPPDGRPWIRRDNAGYRLNADALSAMKIAPARAAEVVKRALLDQPGVLAAFTADEIAAAPATGESVDTLYQRSHYGARSPEVVFALRPFHIDRLGTGSTHGSHHDYDRHVPLIWYGAAVKAARRTEQVSVTDLAPTLAKLLDLPPPAQSSGRNLFE